MLENLKFRYRVLKIRRNFEKNFLSMKITLKSSQHEKLGFFLSSRPSVFATNRLEKIILGERPVVLICNY